MKNKKSIVMICLNLCVFLMSFFLLAGSFGFRNEGPAIKNVHKIDHMTVQIGEQEPYDVTLPCSVDTTEPRTPVSFETEIRPKKEDVIYVKSVYAPAKIYLNDKEVYAFGKAENYPKFMQDPATEVHLVETHGTGEPMTLRMDLLSPVARDHLSVQPLLMGTAKEIIFERFSHIGISFILSIGQLLFGMTIIFIALCLMFFDKNMIIFLWLGFFSLTTGMWSFGENNFTGLIIKNATFLYLISFIGLFIFIVPLLRFTRSIIHFVHEEWIRLMENIILFVAAAAFFLQLSGRLSLAKSMYFMHIALPIILIILTIQIIMEAVKNKNIYARRFILPIGVLAVSAVLELVNYKIVLTYVFSSLFQMGIIVFMVFMGLIAGTYLKDNRNLRNRERELDFEKGLMEIQIREQKHRSDMLAENEVVLSRQRHDLRHHLMAIRELVREDNEELKDYLDQMMADIPKASRKFCQNYPVNAVLSYYYSMCEKEKIDVDFHLDIPQDNQRISDGDLCAIFGNLLENAVEACGRMEEGQRFIRLNTSVQYDTLVITMDNSFNGRVAIEGEHFYSAKRDGYGIGTSSIRTLARKAGGDAIFKINGKIFLSSVYVIL